MRRHEDRVFAILRRSVPAGQVEDLAQESFLRAFRELPRYRGEASFGSWLLRIVRNLIVDRHRRAGRRGVPAGLAEETGADDDALPADPSPGPEEILDRRRLEARLAAALARVVAKERLDAFSIRCFDLLLQLKVSGCLALSNLLAQGVIAGCEGDVPAMLTMLAAQRAAGELPVMMNPSAYDRKRRLLTLAHCTAPLACLEPGSAGITTHFESQSFRPKSMSGTP